MASGDTKTEAMLNVLGNGGSGDEFRGCCNTKTQSYILDAIDRVQGVEDEVEELKNNPDVVDIVDTYADLEAYDTQHLTDNDIIRVLQDETHSGNSTYYRFTKNPDTWTFIGEISGGGGGLAYHEISSADYNFPSDNPYAIAMWTLADNPGVYKNVGNDTVYIRYMDGSPQLDPPIFCINIHSGASFIVLKLTHDNNVTSNYLIYGYDTGILKMYQFNDTGSWYWTDNILLKSSVINNVTTTSTGKPLDAYQGKVLKDLIDALDARVTALGGQKNG